MHKELTRYRSWDLPLRNIFQSNNWRNILGLGIPTTKFSEIIGIFKAYVTRVGNGPFPTELFDNIGETIQDIGKEFEQQLGDLEDGGWFDSVAANYSIKLNGINQIVLTKLDILSEFDSIKVCTAYKNDKNESNDYSEFMNSLDDVNPIYKEFKGWNCDISNIKSYNDLPTNAKDYIEYIQNILDTKISIISVGPKTKSGDRIMKKITFILVLNLIFTNPFKELDKSFLYENHEISTNNQQKTATYNEECVEKLSSETIQPPILLEYLKKIQLI